MAKNVKIPKKIAGVKIPKKARKTANKAIKMSASPVVRELAAAAIGAAGARAAGGSGDRKEESREEGRAGYRAEIHIDGSRVAEAFKVAALDGLRRFLEGFEEGLRELNARAREDEEDEEIEEEERPRRRPASGPRPGAGPG